MLDAGTAPLMQRSRGLARIGFATRDGRTRLTDLFQSGSAKAMLPRGPGAAPEVVFLNTSGGLTGGDRLAYDIAVGPGASVVATTQTAERGYASTGPAATVRVTARVGAGARLDWLPQETILYEDAHLDRETTVDLAGDAVCLLAESVVLGRHAMGEHPLRARLDDARMVRRDGRPVWAERIALDREVLANGLSPALLAGAYAFAVVVLIGRGAEDAVARLRAVLDEPGCRAAASGWDGRCIARIMAQDGWPLKRQMARALLALRAGPLPRVWQMNGDVS